MTDATTKLSQEAEEVVKNFLLFMLEKDMEQWIELWDDNAVFEFPYAPQNYPSKIEGKPAIYNYIKDFPQKMDLFQFSVPHIHHTAASNHVIVEFECEGQVIATGLPYNQKYVSVIQIKDKKIIHYKDYWNPLVAIEAFGGSMESFLSRDHQFGN
ncbi:nuclear transport factor 2 family protein [Brevibacillus formosus]|uniref:nuclear transport factor 2 family protein n=1 Tax=Brevibacillus formosus TaxID=54913 RepID=UPI001C67203E|nr:nuclear transport factor 2 family protein [Brevibacillus formosus]MBW5469229.1 nuclear transport factor 2 family protein [Brevibacillus formosus]